MATVIAMLIIDVVIGIDIVTEIEERIAIRVSVGPLLFLLPRTMAAPCTA
jgi:hypothetical protein